MKKSILFLIFLMSAMLGFGQVKVAVLEPLAGEDGNVTSLEKAIVRGELRKAIVRVEGYEAITRTDIDQLLEEQGFQQTGFVRDQDIHRLGEMCGADYLCVSTLNKSHTQFYLEAYLVDVSTGEILSPASYLGQVERGNMTGLYKICQELIKELIGDRQTTSNKPSTETFEQNTWGWSVFSHDAKSVVLANEELRLTNYSNSGTAQSDVMMPVNIEKNFKVTFNFVVQEAKMTSSVGVRFSGMNTVEVSTGNCTYRVNDVKGVAKQAKMGKGRNRPVVMDIIKNGENISIMVNGIIICETPCRMTTNQFSVFAGPNTLAMLKDVTITYPHK